MDWVFGLQKAVDYIEDNLTETIDIDTVAAQSFSSSYHFQRVFSILCGFTVGEYIRNRRLSLAAAELATGDAKVIDVALKYGYESPDSFARAFRSFHGILPSQARNNGSNLKSFSRLVLNFSLEGGSIMDYRIENAERLDLVGFKRHFEGSPESRQSQVADFYIGTRLNQYALDGMAQDCVTNYEVVTDLDAEGFDYYIAKKMSPQQWEKYRMALYRDADRFEQLCVPAGLYMVCETERCQWPTVRWEELRKKAVTEWLPSSGYELREAPELLICHWYRTDEELKNSRYIEIWLPIVKRDE